MSRTSFHRSPRVRRRRWPCYPAFACLVLSAALSAASFLAIDRCRLSRSAERHTSRYDIDDRLDCVLPQVEQRTVAAVELVLQLLIRRHRTDGWRPSKKGNRPVLVRWFWRS